MVSQDSLTFINTQNNSLTKSISINSSTVDMVIYEYDENNRIDVELNSSNYDVYIESLKKKNNNDYKYLYKLTSNKRITLNTNEESLIPATYIILIKNKNTEQVFYRYFKVNPLVVFENTPYYYDLVNAIRKFEPALLYDENSLSYASKEITDTNFKNFDTLLLTIKKSYNSIINSLHSIYNYPISKIKNTIIKSESNFKQNAKTLRKNAASGKLVYSTKKVIDYKNKENQILKYILLSCSKKIAVLIDKMNTIFTIYEDKIINTNRNIEKNSGNSKYLQKLNEFKKEYNAKLSSYDEGLKMLRNILNRVNEITFNSEFKNIEAKKFFPTQKFLGNQSYNIIYRNLYKLLEENNNYNTSLVHDIRYEGYSFKSTSLLYEIYCLIVLKTIMEDIGFIMEDNARTTDIKSVSDEESYGFFSLTDGKYTCKLIYNKAINNLNGANDEELVNINSQHNKPDFQLLFFDENNEFYYSIILDAKCRHYTSIDIDDLKNEALYTTLLDYMQFRYVRNDEPLLKARKGVHEIMLLFPEKKDKFIINETYGVIYVPLYPSIDYKVTKPYDLLLNHITDILYRKEN